jgi:hypothetical protein
LWFTTADTTFPATTLFATTGSVILNRGGVESDISETYALARSGGNGPYYLTFGNDVLQDGDMVTISGKFSSVDGQSGIDFETVTFKYIGDGTAADMDDYWEVVKPIDYVDSGAIALHGNSVNYGQPDHIWFTTTDTSLIVSGETQMIAETGTVTRTRAGETTDVTSSAYLFCQTTPGLFHFILPGNAGVSAQAGDEITLQ